MGGGAERIDREVRDGVALFQHVFNTRGVEYADTQIFEFAGRSGGELLFRPVRNRAEALFDLAAKDYELAFPYAYLSAFL